MWWLVGLLLCVSPQWEAPPDCIRLELIGPPPGFSDRADCEIAGHQRGANLAESIQKITPRPLVIVGSPICARDPDVFKGKDAGS